MHEVRTSSRCKRPSAHSAKNLACDDFHNDRNDLEHLETIALGGHKARYEWTLETPQGPDKVTIQPRVTATEVGMVRDLAVAGLGIASLPRAFVADDLSAGALVRVLPDTTRGSTPIHAQRRSIRSTYPGSLWHLKPKRSSSLSSRRLQRRNRSQIIRARPYRSGTLSRKACKLALLRHLRMGGKSLVPLATSSVKPFLLIGMNNLPENYP